MKILIADDDKVLSQMLTSAFRKRGWDVVPAYDTMQAVMFAGREPPPDVILLDLSMPGGTGVSALERLKASSKTVTIPVIVISGAEEDDIAERVEMLGAAAFVKKPVDAGRVVAMVEELLGVSEDGEKDSTGS